jgi:thioredoxin reductase
VVIVGAGPAGLAAGLTTAHRALTTLVIEAKSKPGGQPEFFTPKRGSSISQDFPTGSLVTNCRNEHTGRLLTLWFSSGLTKSS